MQISASDGARIDVRIDGDGTRVVVLLAGFPLTRDIWDDVVQRLARAYRVVRPDLRGMGASDAPAGPYLMETLAGDVVGTLDALGIERAAIAGHSLGGYVALAFARMFSERLSGLALVCSRLNADAADAAQNREALAERLERERDAEPLVAAYAERLLSADAKSQRPELQRRIEAMVRAADPCGAAALLRGMAARAASDDIAPELAMPVLVIAGSDDSFVSSAEARAAAETFPNATLRVVERSGHLPMVEDPATTASFVEEWLANVSAT